MRSKPLPLKKIKCKTQDPKLIEYLMLLRFGPEFQAGSTKVTLNYKSIA